MDEHPPEQFPTPPLAGAWHERALRCFGAVPLRAGGEVRLGRLAGTRTLVAVYGRGEPVHVATLLEALAWCDTLPGPLDRVVVLGERFAATILDDLQGLNDTRITLLRVLSVGARPVRFAPLRRLLLHPVLRQPVWWRGANGGRPDERLTVALKDYVEVEEPGGTAGAGVVRSLGLSLLSGWQIDVQYDGHTFRPTWQCSPGSGPPAHAVQIEVPWQPGGRPVCVRATDTQGSVTQVTLWAPPA
jgi:hypothetical protein